MVTEVIFPKAFMVKLRLHILNYARHSLPLSSEGVLTCIAPTVTRAILYNGHLKGPVTLTLVAERLEVELSPPVLTTSVRSDR